MIIYLLIKGVPVHDDDILIDVLNLDDPFVTTSLLSTYGYAEKFIRTCKENSNKKLAEFATLYEKEIMRGEKDCPESAFLAYINVKTPKWEKKFAKIQNEVILAKKSLQDLLSIDLSYENKNDDWYIATTEELISKITIFSDNFKHCRMNINLRRGKFTDYSPFIDDTIAIINSALNYLKNEESNFVDNIVETSNNNPLVHFAISKSLMNKKNEAIVFLNQQLTKIQDQQNSIPDYDKFIESQKVILTEICESLEKDFFEQLNTFYFYVVSKSAVSFIKNTLSHFVFAMIGKSNQEASHQTNLSIDTDLLRSIQTFKLFCASMRIKVPIISEEKSTYQPTKEEKEAITMRKQLQETVEIEEEIQSMQEGIEELKKYSSTCISCHKYCASYACPYCYVFLDCLLCKRTNMTCPVCHQFFEEPLRINKTSYFGDEFMIDLERRRKQEQATRETKS